MKTDTSERGLERLICIVAFSVGAARALVARGVRLVGLDYLSVAHADEQVPAGSPGLNRRLSGWLVRNPAEPVRHEVDPP